MALRFSRSRPARSLAAAGVAGALVLAATCVAPARAADEQLVGTHVKTVQADEAPVSAGSGAAWDGPGVAVLDSGVSPHTDLNLQVQPGQWVDCVDPTLTDGPKDYDGHGTGVAGYLGALDDGKGIVGVAPGVPVYSVRVLTADNRGTPESLLCGLQWVLEHHAELGIKVANLSLAAPGTDDGVCGYAIDDAIHRAVCALANEGVTLVTAAGNKPSTQEPVDLATRVPAAYDEVLVATNMVDLDGAPGAQGTPATDGDAPCTTLPDDTASTSSNFAVSAADQARTLATPGTCPYTTKRGNRAGYVQPGTSMAAAALSGVVLDCLRPSGACVGQSVVGVQATIQAQARASAAEGHRFAGDPFSPIGNRYYGYLASTTPTGPVVVSPVPTIKGTPHVGQRLYVDVTAWTPTGSSFEYQWRADGVSIRGATGNVLPVTADLLGHHLTAVVRGTFGGTQTVRETAGTPVVGVAPAVPPSTSVPTPPQKSPPPSRQTKRLTVHKPRIVGKAKVGRTLKVKTAPWGPGDVKLFVRWEINGKTVKHANRRTFKIPARAKGKRITVVMTGRKYGYPERTLTSAKTAKVKKK